MRRREQRSNQEHIGARLAATEQRFAEIWRQLNQHDRRAAYQQVDPLGLEGQLSLCVRLSGGDWLELALDGDAASGIRWVTYHVADHADHAERLIYPQHTPALWWAAGQYLGRAMDVLLAQRRRGA